MIVAGLVGGRPHVGVRLGVVVEPRKRSVERPPERLAEVAELDAGDVLDQSQQVGAGGCQRSTDVVVAEPLQLPQQCLAGDLQVAVQVRLRIRFEPCPTSLQLSSDAIEPYCGVTSRFRQQWARALARCHAVRPRIPRVGRVAIARHRGHHPLRGCGARRDQARLGHSATLVESAAGPHVFARFGPSSRVLLVGHHDTVFPIGALAARPFGVDAGRATGPGVFDMKARHRAGHPHADVARRPRRCGDVDHRRRRGRLEVVAGADRGARACLRRGAGAGAERRRWRAEDRPQGHRHVRGDSCTVAPPTPASNRRRASTRWWPRRN